MMILLLGGTSETSLLAHELAAVGCRTIVSTATNIPLPLDCHPNICRCSGRLEEGAMAALIREEGIRVIVDCTHPYATMVHATARKVADSLEIPILTLLRPSGIDSSGETVIAADHEEAARLAFSFGRPVFLTTGAKNLLPYVRESRRVGVSLIVRVLPERGSMAACHNAGIPEVNVITGRGPFSIDENRSVIRRFGIGVLVAKDSGPVGGTPEKIAAARLEGCRLIVVRRPARPTALAFESPTELVQALLEYLRTAEGKKNV